MFQMKYLAICFVLAIAIQLVFAGVNPELRKRPIQRCLQNALSAASNCQAIDEEPKLNKSCVLEVLVGLEECLDGKYSLVDIRKYVETHENFPYMIDDESDSGYLSYPADEEYNGFTDEDPECHSLGYFLFYRDLVVFSHLIIAYPGCDWN